MNTYKHDNIFFTSDCHFAHKNIIKFCDRPFENVTEMHQTIIKNWNDEVTNRDFVFILGDFCFGGSALWRHILSQLNGLKILILGNHDTAGAIPQSLFYEIHEQLLIKVEDFEENKEQFIFLSHYPMLSWPHSSRNSWQLFGHVHSKLDRITEIDKKLVPNQYDVGMDNNNFKLLSFNNIKHIINHNNKYTNARTNYHNSL